MVDLHDSLRPTGTASPLPISELAARAKRRTRRRLAVVTGSVAVTIGITAFAISNLPQSPPDTVTVADEADGSEQLGTPESLGEESASQPSPPTTSTLDANGSTSAGPSTSPPSTEPTTSTPDQAPGSEDEADQTTSSTTAADTVAGGTTPTEPGPVTTPGIRTETTITSEWEDGYCIQIEVTNDTADGEAWQVVLELDGTIATTWNADVVEANTGTFVFTGLEGYNATIQRGAASSFGTCVDTNVD